MAPHAACCAPGSALPGTLQRWLGTTPAQHPAYCNSVISDIHPTTHTVPLVGSHAQPAHHALNAVALSCLLQQSLQAQRPTSKGLGALRLPVPSLVYRSSALPAFAKHNTRSLQHPLFSTGC